ncbi:M1 family metallopeptidase [Candidatus Saccharibacteria bacterium]|nr:M1 family metallopeptidase [Candidatus Saccharibacteria bacterium]
MIERLLTYFTPENYTLSLKIDKAKAEIKGHVIITGLPKESFARFHAKNLKIKKANFEYSYIDDILEIKGLPKNKPARIEIDFIAPIQTAMHGAYFSKYKYKGEEKLIVTTQFESHCAREVFPCIDEPAAKATFDLTLTHAKSDLALSNTPISKQTNLKNSTKTIFHQTPKMSTHLLAFVVGELHKVETESKHGIKISTYAPLNQPLRKLNFANQVAADTLDFFTDKFKTPYPLAKLDQVALPDFEAGAMENWGLVTYRECLLLVDNKSSVEARKSVAIVIAHELAHQWFGNLVTMQWWDDLWLNESFATMIEYVAIDSLFPEWHIMNDFFLNERFYAMNRDSISGVQTIRQPVHSPDEITTIFDGAIVYAKGACLMHMLREKLGNDNFFAGLQDYFSRHAYGNTTGDDLWNAMQPYADFDVKDFMEQWLTQPNFPIISHDKSQKPIVKNANTNWLITDIKRDLSGYYLLEITEESLASFVSEANAEGQEKMRTLLDANILSRTNNLPSRLLFNIISNVKHHDEEIIWSLNLSLLKTLKLFFSDDHTSFQSFINKSLSPKLDQIDIIKSDNEPPRVTELRSALLSWLLHAKNPNVTEFLLSNYNDDFTTIDNDLRSFVLIAHLQNNFSDNLFHRLIDEYRHAEDPELKDDLETAISSVKTSKHIDHVLSLLQDFKIVRPQDTLGFFAGLARGESSRDASWRFLRDNWTWFESNFGGGKSLDYYPKLIASTLKTENDLKDFTEFFAPHKKNIELSRAIIMGEEEIKTRVELISSNESEVLLSLEKYVTM